MYEIVWWSVSSGDILTRMTGAKMTWKVLKNMEKVRLFSLLAFILGIYMLNLRK